MTRWYVPTPPEDGARLVFLTAVWLPSTAPATSWSVAHLPTAIVGDPDRVLLSRCIRGSAGSAVLTPIPRPLPPCKSCAAIAATHGFPPLLMGDPPAPDGASSHPAETAAPV